MDGELVRIPIRRGSSYENQSGLNLLAPTIYGRLAAEGCSKRTAFVVIHPASNFMDHYLIEPMRQRGCAIMALNTRYVGNDSVLLMENAIRDLGAGIRHLRKAGYEQIVLLANSGGAALASLYQAEAENLTIKTTPDGRPVDLLPEDLPPANAMVLLAAHPGRARVMTECIDPSIIDERDRTTVNAALDMYNPENGPPYDREWLRKYRVAQLARNERLTDWVLSRIRLLEARNDPQLINDEPFIIYGTYADPRYLDLTLDPNDRAAGSLRGHPRGLNVAPNFMGRVSTLRSFLSQWSLRYSRADVPTCLPRTSVPILNVVYSADEMCFPGHQRMLEEAAGDRCQTYTVKGGTHHLHGQPSQINEVADLLAAWSEKLTDIRLAS